MNHIQHINKKLRVIKSVYNEKLHIEFLFRYMNVRRLIVVVFVSTLFNKNIKQEFVNTTQAKIFNT